MARRFARTAVCMVALLLGCALAAVEWSYIDATAQVTNADGTIAYRASHGDFNVPHKVPMYHRAQFPIASNTKLFTAVAMYQLQEAGLVNVSAEVSDYLNATDFANFGFPSMSKYCPTLLMGNGTACQPLTFRHLMSMSSGIYAEMRCDPQPGAAAAGLCNFNPFVIYPGSIAAMVGTFIAKPLVFAPGTAYEYSNPNFILCAYIIEKLSGMAYGDYLQQHIFNVVGMPSTYFDPYNGQYDMNPNRVGVYHRFVDAESGELMGTGANTMDFDLGSLSGTGGLVSSIDDVEKWYRVLFNFTSKGYPLLKDPASFDAILAPLSFITPPGPLPCFYTQGVTITCAKDDPLCDKGPTFIVYEGGTLVVRTGNVFDVRITHPDGRRRYQMSQVWASSHVFNMTQTTYKLLRTKAQGNFFEVALRYALPTPGAMGLTWQLQAEYGPSPLSG